MLLFDFPGVDSENCAIKHVGDLKESDVRGEKSEKYVFNKLEKLFNNAKDVVVIHGFHVGDEKIKEGGIDI